MSKWLTIILATCLLPLGCHPSLESSTGDLVDPALWLHVEGSTDPFTDLAPENSSCDERGIKFEEGVLEIDTGLCGFYTGTQATRMTIQRGDTLSWLIYHGALAASEPTTGYVALQIGAQIVFERLVPIPYSSRIYAETMTADFDTPAGSPVYFHVHNHGANSWRIAHVRLNEEL